ncbi:transposase [Streptomyces sp. NPDC008222]|uniref:transposase n=1 Tax=Streptomyces sp. NPDC008222 TaxID=3364820 RepID=UPI0036E1A510
MHHRPVLGPAASDSTLRRLLALLDEAALVRIAKARRRVRRQVWSLLTLRPGGFPWLTVAGRRLAGWIVVDMDATIITAASKKERTAPTFKGAFGFHPLADWCADTDECLAMGLRPGNAGANTVEDHLRVLKAALAQVALSASYFSPISLHAASRAWSGAYWCGYVAVAGRAGAGPDREECL